MSYLALLFLLEFFTIRSVNKYDNGIIVRCRKFILSIYQECLLTIPNNYSLEQFESFIDYIYTRSFSLPDDEFMFIRSFRRYVKKLTKL